MFLAGWSSRVWIRAQTLVVVGEKPGRLRRASAAINHRPLEIRISSGQLCPGSVCKFAGRLLAVDSPRRLLRDTLKTLRPP